MNSSSSHKAKVVGRRTTVVDGARTGTPMKYESSGGIPLDTPRRGFSAWKRATFTLALPIWVVKQGTFPSPRYRPILSPNVSLSLMTVHERAHLLRRTTY